ncbi:recombinase family protein [Ferruginibacter sp.]|nr:recombinase family protein [Ferruginibacter sp.]
MKEINQNNDINIEQGVYQDHYLIYNRKSTDEPENQKNSLHYQRAENLKYALSKHLSIAPVSIPGFCTDGIIAEKHSAYKEDEIMIISDNGVVQFRIERPKFHKLIQMLNKKIFKGVIFLCWDRASRNDADEAILKKLLKNDIDLRFTLVSYDKSSSGALHMDIDGMFAQHHSRVTSEKVKLNIRNQREKGICTSKAPVGYLNLGTMENKPLDSVRAPVIKQLFEKYATGNWSIAELTTWAITQGFTMSPMRRKRTIEEKQKEEESDMQTEITPVAHIPSRSAIHKILSSPFYMGKTKGNDGTFIKSNSHEPLISEELFMKVQRMLKKKNVSVKYSSELFYPYRGLIRCASCQRVYTPYIKKGIQYYCVNCKPLCENKTKNFNNRIIDSIVSKTIEKLILTEDELLQIEESTKIELPEVEQKRTEHLASIDRQKRKIQEDITYLQQNKLNLLRTGVYTPENYLESEQQLNNKYVQLIQQEQTTTVSILEVVQKVIELSELLKNLMLYDFIANPAEKDEVTRYIFSELYFSENSLQYKCKNGFEALEQRLVSCCALKEWIYELPSHQERIKQSIKELEIYSNNLQERA